MDANDRRAIEDLFEKLAEVERNSPPRDREAGAFIDAAIIRAPAAPYYMAQTIIVQQQALEAAQRRIEELEEGGDRENEGFLSGIFGGRARQPDRDSRRFDERQQGGPWARGNVQGGGFLAGAAQTAMGVAGGVLLGNMIAGMFGGGSANAAEARNDDRRDDNDRNDDRNDNDRSDSDHDDGGSDFADAGGDFGGGDF
jgi:hypothetical protein